MIKLRELKNYSGEGTLIDNFNFSILEWSHSARDFMYSFEDWLYKVYSSPECESNPDWVGRGLGKSFSYFLVGKTSPELMVLLDYDDGNGYKPVDFKLDARLFDHLMNSHGLQRYVVFKSQKSSSPELCKNYPIPSENVYPLGYFCNDPIQTALLKPRMSRDMSKRDIDVFWCGTVPNYPDSDWKYEDLDIKYWGSRVRRLGYEKLCDIKSRRDDLNIFISNEIIPFEEYVDLISRSKVCIDLPGVGFHTRRLMELLTLQRCTLACEKINELHFDLIDERHVHRYNIDYSNLEEKIDYLLSNLDIIEKTEDNLSEIQRFLTWDHAAKNMFKTIEKRLA